jgi:ribosomal protein RSM22 (predicted rRNA methylase)
MVLSTFMLNNIPDIDQRAKLLRTLWSLTSANGKLVLIEEGNDQGFESIVEARSNILAFDAHATVVTPCFHNKECPMLLKRYSKLCTFEKRIQVDPQLVKVLFKRMQLLIIFCSLGWREKELLGH